ncbi:hypothetical protein GCM10027060_01010 [Nesterenkonia halophila]|uniref:hypothetical protein n=1 Tax=Nesterenkonia halophila TaxID=302044 RepID=UPI0012917805|nr:hypothetical protein [Nesterenkonia halophila]
MLDVRSMSFHDRHALIVPPTRFRIAAGELVFLEIPTPAGRTAASLILSGRMAPEGGELLLDDEPGLRARRRAAAVVDAEGITSPEHFMSVRRVVAESLGLRPLRARLPHRRDRIPSSPRAWMQAHDWSGVAGDHVDALPAPERIELLTLLAFADPQVRLAVLDSPDRHDLTGETLEDTLAALVDEESDTSVIAVVDRAPAGTDHRVVTADEPPADEEPDDEAPAPEAAPGSADDDIPHDSPAENR